MLFDALNQFADHIYVITLEREPERQENIIKRLEGLNYTFFFGVDKKNLVMDELIQNGIYDEDKAIALNEFDKPLNTGQIATSLSHRMVYEDMIKNGYKTAVVLEDDVTPVKEGLERLENSMQEIPKTWGLIYFDCDKNLCRNVGTFFKQIGCHIKTLFRRSKMSHFVINNMFARKLSENILIAGMHDCTTAYAITLATAKKLLELQTPVCFESDALLSHVSTNKLVSAYVYRPKAFKKNMQLVTKTLID